MKTFNHSFKEIPKLKQINTEKGRRYGIDEKKKYPSITTVLNDTADKTWLYEWRNRVGAEKANAISKAATTRGTAMHKLCEKYLLNEDIGPYYDESTMGTFLFANIKPALERMDNIRALESTLYSDALGVAGTVDCIAELDGNLSIIDFKTASRPKQESKIEDYFLQGCFYFTAYYERTGELPNQIAILISVQDSSYQEFKISGREIIRYILIRIKLKF